MEIKLNLGMLRAQLAALMFGKDKNRKHSHNILTRNNTSNRPWPKPFGGKRQWKARRRANNGNGKSV